MTAPQLRTRTDVEALYDSLAGDIITIAELGGSPDPVMRGEIFAVLATEARLLDLRQFERWYEMYDADAWFWVPLTTVAHPGKDQALILDDYRRLNERVWRMRDTSAWALHPAAETVRMIGSVESWDIGEAGGLREVISTSALMISFTRMGQTRFLSARQVHRLRRHPDGWHIFRKIMLIPEIAAATPHLGWLL